MPLVRIDLREGKTAEFKKALGDSVHKAMVETLGIPSHDRFQVTTDHPASGLDYDPSYLNIQRTDETVFIQITVSEGRSSEVKQALYARIIALVAEQPGIRPQDVLISLIEVAKENWSFGSGEAQYLG